MVFDIDGTLLQSAAIDDALYKKSIESVLGPVQFRSSLADYDFVTDSGILSQVLEDNSIVPKPNPTVGVITQFVKLLESHIRDNGPFHEIPGARRLIDKLRMSKNHSVAIATGGWQESSELKLVSAGFDLTDVPLATSSDSSDREEIMKIALSRLGAEFESVSYYGDGPWDRDACRALGWNFIAVGAELSGINWYNGVCVA